MTAYREEECWVRDTGGRGWLGETLGFGGALGNEVGDWNVVCVG